jgi:hypothetical protein
MATKLATLAAIRIGVYVRFEPNARRHFQSPAVYQKSQLYFGAADLPRFAAKHGPMTRYPIVE